MALAKTIDDYQARLEWLSAETDPLVPRIRAAGGAQSWWPEGAAWSRSYARLDPGEAPYCTLAYVRSDGARQACLVELFESAPQACSAAHWLARDDLQLGWIRLMPCTSDPGLTTLDAALRRLRHYRILRYRPYRRCTLLAEGAGGPAIVKAFADDRGARIHASGIALWQAAARGELEFLVAEPIRWDADTRCLHQRLVDGRPVADRLFGAGGGALAARMGQACGSIATAPLRPALRSSAAETLQSARSKALRAAAIAPTLATEIESFIGRLANLLAHTAERAPRPIHGAPHTHQWLESGDALGLVDFDGFKLGDPELDVAAFVGELDFERHTRVPVSELTETFIEAYQARAGALDRLLLDCYRAERRFEKVCRTLQAARPGRLQAAARHLQRAHACLARHRG